MVALTLADAVLILAALAFAWSIGAHYTGACMGMAYAARALSRRQALGWMALLTAVGAALASGRVVGNIGLNLVGAQTLTVAAAAAVVLAAFALTSAYNLARIPTSTIQIFVFCLLGVATGLGISIHWGNVVNLVELWAVAPVAALGLGYLLTRGLSRGAPAPSSSDSSIRWGLPATGLLVVMALAASFAMGANDVANATAVFVSTGLTDTLVAGLVGGVALALGVVTWGGPLLSRVASDIVQVDRPMAIAAQGAQAIVILVAVVAVGAFTSMNQALIGGMAGAGIARGERTIRWPVLRGVLLGWAVGPASGFAAGLAVVHGAAFLGVPL